MKRAIAVISAMFSSRMKSLTSTIFVAASIFIFSYPLRAQADEICREFGETPTREIGRENRLAPYIYGRIVLKGLRSDAKIPLLTVVYSDTSQPAIRQKIGRSGNYCFRRFGNSGTIIVDLDGVEVARKLVSDIGGVRQREDFEIFPPQFNQTAPPGVISSKFVRPPNGKTLDLYRQTAEAERDKQPAKAIDLVKKIVAADPDDFIAWAKLGTLYNARNSSVDAESAFQRSIDIRADYTPALLSLGILRALKGENVNAIAFLKRAVASDPNSSRAHRLLGEAYLQNRQGTLGLATLDEALRLDPVGMAECHLLKARLYDLAGARDLASQEYKAMLAKLPNHPDKKKFEKYIAENSPK